MAPKLEACAACKRKCLLCHSKSRISSPLVSSFFKVMVTDNYSKVLFLPPKFAPKVSTLLGKEVPLEDSNGQQWKAKLTVFENSVALVQGWDTFAKDHGLEVGDFLSFHYILGSRFFVQIFDRTCCEKLDFPMKTRAKADKGPAVKREQKSSAFTNPKNGSSTNKKGVAIFREPSFLDHRKGKRKINELSDECVEFEAENVDTLRTYNLDTRGSKRVERAKDFSHNMKTCYLKTQAGSNIKPSQAIVPFGSFDREKEKAKSRKKPKAEPVDDDPIYVPPIQCSDEFIKRAKVEASKPETLAISMAGSVSCVIGRSRTFLKLPEGLPSSSKKRRTMDTGKRIVLLKGPKPQMKRVEYHETSKLKILMKGWEDFCKYNNIVEGDECTFEVEDEVEDEAADTFRVSVVSMV